MDLVGKIVKVKDYSDLLFYYPNFVVKSRISPIDFDENIIFTGPINSRTLSQLNGRNWIGVRGMYSVDLVDRKSRLNFVFDKYGQVPPNSLVENIDLFDDEEFDYCCKVYWVCGRWPYKVEEEESMYHMFENSVNSSSRFLESVMKLMEVYDTKVLEASWFTFMLRSEYVDEQNVSPRYKRLLKQFSVSSGSRVKKAILNYLDSGIDSHALRFLSLLMSIKNV